MSVSGRKLDSEETANRSQINKGNRFRKSPVQQVKIPEGNTDYTGRGLEISRSVSWKKLSKIELNLH